MIKDDGWGKEWPSNAPIAEVNPPNDIKQPWPIIPKPEWLKDVTDIKFTKQGSNLVDDQAYLYFQCEGCQKIFDPSTRSFGQLNQRRADAGWKVKWNVDGMGYKVYCVECGEK